MGQSKLENIIKKSLWAFIGLVGLISFVIILPLYLLFNEKI